MKVTAVNVDTLELAYDEPFVVASSALQASQGEAGRVPGEQAAPAERAPQEV